MADDAGRILSNGRREAQAGGFDVASLPTGSRGQVLAFSRAILWVARDALGSFRRDIAAAFALDLLGVATGALALGGILVIVRSLDSDSALGFADVRVPATAVALLSLIGLFTAIGLLSAFCVYSGAWRIARVAIAYENKCRERLIRISADPAYRGWQALVLDRPSAALATLCNHGTRVCSVVLRRTLSQILPIAMVGVGSAALVVVDPFLTLLLAPLAVPYLVLLLRVGRDATRHQQEYVEKSRIAKRRVNRVVDSIVTRSASAEWKLGAGAAVLEEPEQHEAADLFYQRRLAPTRMQLFSSGLLATCLAAVVSFFALTGDGTVLPWFTMLFYLVVLRFTIGALRQVASAIAVLSRHYPEATRMARFVEGAGQLRTRRESAAGAARIDAVEIRAADPPRWGGAAAITLRPGAPLVAIAAPRPDHGELERVAAQISAAATTPVDLLANAAVLAKPLAPTIHPDASAPGDAALLGDLGVADEIERFAKQRREASGGESEPDLGKEAVFALGAAPLARPHDATVLAARTLLGLAPGFVSRLLARESAGLVVLVDDRPGTCFRSAFQDVRDQFAGAVVLAGGRVVACGDLDWLRAHARDISEALTPPEPTARDDSNTDIDDEEDL